MGCALSHMAVWQKLLDDKREINTYLILEDDAVVNSELITLFNMIHDKHLPADWDVIYLGGVLPPNRQGFESCIEPVNEFLGRVKKNTLFNEKGSNYFHFCAYSYILRRSGAEKLMRMCKEREGCWAPADHLICNAHDTLNIYFTNTCAAEAMPPNTASTEYFSKATGVLSGFINLRIKRLQNEADTKLTNAS